MENVLILGAGRTAKALASRFLQDNINVDVINRSQGRLSYFKDIGCTCHTSSAISRVKSMI